MLPDRDSSALSGSHPRTGPCRALLAAAWLAAALAGGVSPARTAPPALAGPSRDTELTLHVRKALLNDPQLGRLNLWVTVRDRVATVSGDVPNAGLASRAVDLVNRVQGVGEVKNGTRVVTGDGVADASAWPTAFPQGPLVAGAVKRTSSSADLTSHLTLPPAGLEQGGPAPHSGGLEHVVPGHPPGQPMAQSPGSRSPGVFLGRPVALPSLSEQPSPLPSPAAPATPPNAFAWAKPAPGGPAALLAPRPLPPAEDVSTTVEKLRSGNPRLARVRVRVQAQDGLVALGGAVERWGDIEELAGAVRRLPGVRAVILENVRIDRASDRGPASAPAGRR